MCVIYSSYLLSFKLNRLLSLHRNLNVHQKPQMLDLPKKIINTQCVSHIYTLSIGYSSSIVLLNLHNNQNVHQTPQNNIKFVYPIQIQGIPLLKLQDLITKRLNYLSDNVHVMYTSSLMTIQHQSHY